MLESHGRRREDREDKVDVMVSATTAIRKLILQRGESSIPIRAASLSFLLLVMTGTLSASVMSKSGRAKGSKMPPEDWRIRTVPSRCRSFMWFISTA